MLTSTEYNAVNSAAQSGAVQAANTQAWVTAVLPAVSASAPSSMASGTVSVTPYVATSDDYTALSSVFALVLVAAAITWGLKQVYNTIANQVES